MNRKALQDKYAQLSIQIRAQRHLCAELKKTETHKFVDADKKLRRLLKEQQELIRRLHQ